MFTSLGTTDLESQTPINKFVLYKNNYTSIFGPNAKIISLIVASVGIGSIGSSVAFIQGPAAAFPVLIGSVFTFGSIGVLYNSFAKEIDVTKRKFANLFRKDKLPENVISTKITNPQRFTENFGNQINHLIALAQAEHYDTERFILTLNQFFSKEVPSVQDNQNNEAVSQNFKNARAQIYTILNEGKKDPNYDGCIGQFLFLSQLMLHLRNLQENQLTVISPRISLNTLEEAYKEFCEEQFIPYCCEKFGDAQSRFVNNYVNNLLLSSDGRSVFNFQTLSNHARELREFHGDMSDSLPVRSISNIAEEMKSEEEKSNFNNRSLPILPDSLIRDNPTTNQNEETANNLANGLIGVSVTKVTSSQLANDAKENDGINI